MIKLNLSKKLVNEDEINGLQEKISNIHHAILNREGKGAEFTDWLTWAEDYDKDEFAAMLDKVKQLKENGVNKLLVIGIGGSYLGAKSALDFVKGSSYDDVRFIGINTTADYYKQTEEWLKGSAWGIVIISKSGTTLEPALAFRYFRTLLEREVSNTSEYIIAVTDKEKGTLKSMATENNWTTFVVPDGIGGRFSGITPVGLFVMAFAGINIQCLMNGVRNAQNDLLNDGSLDNPAYKYAAVRYLLNTQYDYDVEMFATYDTDLTYTSEWLKQLFGESEGKDGKGLLPTSANFTADLHSLGQWLQEGKRELLFTTTLWVENSNNDVKIPEASFKDGLDGFAGVSLDVINNEIKKAVLDAHYEGGNPQILISIPDKKDNTLGYLWYFFFMVVTMTGYLLQVNPFDQPGVEKYKANMKSNLEKIKK